MAKNSSSRPAQARSTTSPKDGARPKRQLPLPENRLDRWLAGGFIGLIGLSVLCFILLMLASALHWFGSLLGPVYVASLLAVAYFGLPVAVILMIVLTIRVAIRRNRENKTA